MLFEIEAHEEVRAPDDEEVEVAITNMRDLVTILPRIASILD